MGQINITQIQDQNEIIIPPSGVDGIYNEGGTLYVINSSGASYSLVSATGVSGVGVAGQSTYWVSPNVLGARPSSYSRVGATVSGSSVERIVFTFSYPGDSFKQHDILQWLSTSNFTVGAGINGATTSLYINTTPNLSGTPQIILQSFQGPVTTFSNVLRHIWIGAGTQSFCYGNFISPPVEDYDQVNTSWKELNIDWTQTQWFILTTVGGTSNVISLSTKLFV